MKKQLTILLMLASVMFGYSVLAEQAYADTNVGGIIDADTTWTLSNSPYFITDTVQIPSDITLTIEPGVVINKPTDGDMFLLNGAVYAHGTNDNKIIFDGGGNSNFFIAAGETGNVSTDYCKVQNGYSFWNRGGYFNLTHSELTNIDDAHLDDPSGDTYIEYNKFINTGGVSAYQAAGRNHKVYIRYNLFQNTSPIYNHGGSPGQNEMIVNYNSFVNSKTGLMLSLSPNFDTAIMNATNNYWGAQDVNVIDSMIYDKNDDITVENYINYLPILVEPHPDTPKTDENNPEEIPTTTIFDGDIIQCQNSSNPSAVYIVKIVGATKYIRHIVSLEIFNHYKHLSWDNLKQADSLDNYSLSSWVRVSTDSNEKVYEINSDQIRHWINMTADDFLTHGGSEPAIFNINQGELNLYTAGPDVMSL